MRYPTRAAVTALAFVFMAPAAQADDRVYANFPVTLKGYTGDAKDSVAYKGQIARQLLHDSLKVLAGQGNGQPNADLKAKMMAYFNGEDGAKEMLAPKPRDPFAFVQSTIHDVGRGKLSDKAYKGTVTGWPNNLTGPELLALWIDKAAAADKGYDKANGYNYVQLISKFMLGAVFYNQAVDNYLDENLAADVKPNDKPYSDGAVYTGKEHVWDEAFGYFGVPAHGLAMSASDIYYTARIGNGAKEPAKVLAAADHDKDGKIDLYDEMAYQPAYYAASFDIDGKTNYVHAITKAFLDGRQLIASAKGEKLTDAQRGQLRAHAATIETNWERSLAEATFKYAGEVYKDLQKLQAVLDAKGETDQVMSAYINHWGELKGFSLALQAGRKNLGETAVVLNRLIGYGPVLANSSQVIDVDSAGNYVKGEASVADYMLHMLKVQQLMLDKFQVQARQHDVLADMKMLTDKIGTGTKAEND